MPISSFSRRKVTTSQPCFGATTRESIESVVTVPDCSKAVFLQVLMKCVYMDIFTVSIDDVVEVWVLAHMYQIEGLRCCLGSLERNLWEENDASRILKQAEDLSCPCEKLKRISLEVSKSNNY